MVNAQQWLDKWYPKNGVCQLKKNKGSWGEEENHDNENYGKTRKEITELKIAGWDLEGTLNLNNFPNLRIIDCGFNRLTNVVLSVNNQIESLWCPCNQLTSLPVNLNHLSLTVLGLRDNRFHSDLTIFSQLVNLEKLYIGQNQFTGSLTPLVNLTKLKEAHVLLTQVDSGLEYLPEHLERFYCGGTKLFEILAPYMNPEYGAPQYGIPGKDGYYNLSKWRKNNQETINKTHRIMTNWKENSYPFKNFTEKLTQEWIDCGFDKKEAREWLESDLKINEANFAQWLRDELKINAEEFLNNYDDQDLRKQYANHLENNNYVNNWKNIHPSLTPELQHEWEKNGFDYQQTKEWLEGGLQPTDAYYARWLKNSDKTPKWFLEHGIEDMVSYSMFSHKGELRRSKGKVNAQEWLNKKYSAKERKNITELNINGKSLAGSLIIKDWPTLEIIFNEENQINDLNLDNLPKLREVYLTWDPLTRLTINNCPLITKIDLSSNELTDLKWLDNLAPENVTYLNVSDNKFPVQDLSVFSRFINLKELYLNSNNFTGSLEPLKNLTKLETLNISYTKIDSGLEYLPVSLKEFICADTRLKEILKPYQGDLKKWREDNQKLINNLKNLSEKSQLETQSGVISGSKKNKNAKLREAKEQIVQLQAELVVERSKNADLEKIIKELQEKQAFTECLQDEQTEVDKAEEKLSNLQITQETRAQIQIPPK